MNNKLKKMLAMMLAVLTLITCFAVSTFAVVGTNYTDSFTTTSSVMMSKHNYGYRDIKMRAEELWSRSGNQEFRLYLYTKNGSNYSSQGYCLCDTDTSGGEFVWYNANTNTTLPKPAYFIASKTAENSVEIGGKIVSWSQE